LHQKESDDQQEIDSINKNGQTLSTGLWFMKQTIGNACGTIGVIHSLANNASALNYKADSHIAKFIELTKSLDPSQRAKALEDFEAFATVHEDSAREGQTRPPGEDEDVSDFKMIWLKL
jgi:ubiquitin carboxyl-terminal hydrolase L3